MKSVTFVRRIAARPSIVFDALATADGVAAWFGPDELPVLHSEVDARVGGAFRVRFRTLDGREHEARGEYLEVVPSRRLVMSWRWADGGEPEERGQTSRVEIDLTPIASGTELVFTHGELQNEASRKSHEGGWTGALRKLVRHLEGAGGSADLGKVLAAVAIVATAALGGLGTACAPPAVSPASPAAVQVAASQPPSPPAPSASPSATPYPKMAPIERYRMASDAEIALARSAAPPSISNDAEVRVLGPRGYETAASGKNGFVCIVERSWACGFDSPEFWNPRMRGPQCYNAAAARSVLPAYFERTTWVLAGASVAEMGDRTRAAVASGQIRPPEVGSMSYMMSKDGYLGDEAGGHWHPHVMFFLPRSEPSAWGANVHGSPVVAPPGNGVDLVTVFIAVVPMWSDGTPGPAPR
ncbi:MAG TPA: SRPBCC domain-containing protein [Polyangiaceae bacterium]|jgi:uncharacterized protein YndB with AHSA1/START domain